MKPSLSLLQRAWSGLCARLGLEETESADDALAALDTALEGANSRETLLNQAIASGRIAEIQRDAYLNASHGDVGVLRALLNERPAGAFKPSETAMPSPAAADSVCRQLGITRDEYEHAGRFRARA